MKEGKRDEDQISKSNTPRLGWTAQGQARTPHRCVWSTPTLPERTAAPLERRVLDPHPRRTRRLSEYTAWSSADQLCTLAGHPQSHPATRQPSSDAPSPSHFLISSPHLPLSSTLHIRLNPPPAMSTDPFYMRYYSGHVGSYGHEFIEFEISGNRLRFALNTK